MRFNKWLIEYNEQRFDNERKNMKHDEWALSKELGRLRQYGLYLQAERVIKNERYNIVHEKNRTVFEPYCTVEEVLGITNALEQYINSNQKVGYG